MEAPFKPLQFSTITEIHFCDKCESYFTLPSAHVTQCNGATKPLTREEVIFYLNRDAQTRKIFHALRMNLGF